MARRRWDTSTRRRSPIGCPRVSLTSLNWSRSRHSRANGAPVRMRSSSSLRNSERFGSPVSSSKWAMRSMRLAAWSRSVMSSATTTSPPLALRRMRYSTMRSERLRMTPWVRASPSADRSSACTNDTTVSGEPPTASRTACVSDAPTGAASSAMPKRLRKRPLMTSTFMSLSTMHSPSLMLLSAVSNWAASALLRSAATIALTSIAWISAVMPRTLSAWRPTSASRPTWAGCQDATRPRSRDPGPPAPAT